MKWILALCLPVLLVLSACSPSGGPQGDEQVLRVGVASLPSSLGNPYRGNGRPGSLLWHAIFDGLTRLDYDGDPEPALAVDWELVSPTVWRFTLRSDIRYSNGRPFDAHAGRRKTVEARFRRAGRKIRQHHLC